MPTRAEAERIAQEDAMMRQIAMQAAQQRQAEQVYQRNEANLDKRGQTQLAIAQEQAKAQLEGIRAQIEGQRGIAGDTRNGMIELKKTPEAMSEGARLDRQDKTSSFDYKLDRALGKMIGDDGQPVEQVVPTAQAPMQAVPSKPTRPQQPLPSDPGFRDWYKSKYGPGAEPSSSGLYDPNSAKELAARVDLVRSGAFVNDDENKAEWARQGLVIDPDSDYATVEGKGNDDFYSVGDKYAQGASIQGPDGRWVQIAKPGVIGSPVAARQRVIPGSPERYAPNTFTQDEWGIMLETPGARIKSATPASVKSQMMPTPPVAGITGNGSFATTATPVAAVPTPTKSLTQEEVLKRALDAKFGVSYETQKQRQKENLVETETISQAKATLGRLAALPSLTPVGQKRWEEAKAILESQGIPSVQWKMPYAYSAQDMADPLVAEFDKIAGDRAGGLSYSSDDDMLALQLQARAIEKKMRDAGYSEDEVQDVLLRIRRAAQKSDMPFGWGGGRFSSEQGARIAYRKD